MNNTGAEAVFLRPWPYKMEKFIRDGIAAARQKPVDAASNVAGGEAPSKGE